MPEPTACHPTWTVRGATARGCVVPTTGRFKDGHPSHLPQLQHDRNYYSAWPSADLGIGRVCGRTLAPAREIGVAPPGAGRVGSSPSMRQSVGAASPTAEALRLLSWCPICSESRCPNSSHTSSSCQTNSRPPLHTGRRTTPAHSTKTSSRFSSHHALPTVAYYVAIHSMYPAPPVLADQHCAPPSTYPSATSAASVWHPDDSRMPSQPPTSPRDPAVAAAELLIGNVLHHCHDCARDGRRRESSYPFRATSSHRFLVSPGSEAMPA